MKIGVLRLILAIGLMLAGFSGSALAEEAGPPSANLPVESWVGQSFVFLALPADKQDDGYDIYAEDQAARGWQGDQAGRIPYAAHVAKQVTIIRVVATADPVFDYIVHMEERETGMKLAGRTIRGQLEGLAPARDRENARQQFVGRTIYTKRTTLIGVADPATNPGPLSLTVPLGTPILVTDVWDGIQSAEPVWLVVSVHGQKAVLPIAYSWTNQPANSWSAGLPWQQVLFLEDPRQQAGWSQEVWNSVVAGEVKKGMTKEQVRLSWGNPSRTDETSPGGSRWFYGNTWLDFTGEVVAAVNKEELKDSVTP
ncbi:MAG: hypothetical protein P4N41_09505 [Negativicutes bacterium]|nr:hypothetical protein [Negativicutes bacterium]